MVLPVPPPVTMVSQVPAPCVAVQVAVAAPPPVNTSTAESCGTSGPETLSGLRLMIRLVGATVSVSCPGDVESAHAAAKDKAGSRSRWRARMGRKARSSMVQYYIRCEGRAT